MSTRKTSELRLVLDFTLIAALVFLIVVAVAFIQGT